MTNEELNDLLAQAEENNKRNRYVEAEELSSHVLSSLEPVLNQVMQLEGAVQTDDDPELHVLYCRALLASAASAREQAEYHRSLDLAMRSLQHAEKAKLTKSSAWAEMSIGQAHYNLGSYDKALECYARSLAAFRELEDKTGVAKVTSSIGVVHFQVGSFDKALECYERAVAAFEELGNKFGVARNTANVGTVHLIFGTYDKALDCFERALFVFEELGEKTYQAIVNDNIGNVHNRLRSFDKAFEYYQRSLSGFEELGDKSRVAHATGNIGLLHNRAGSPDKALEYCMRALAMFEELGQETHKARLSGNFGDTYYQLRDYDKALEYYARALSIHEVLGQKSGVAGITGNIGSVYGTKEYSGYDAPKAEQYLLRALEICSDIGLNEGLLEFHKNLSEVYELEGRDKEALVHFKRHIEVKEQINAEEVRKQAEQREREKQIELAKAASDAQMSATTGLLHKVLPSTIATRMLRGEEEIADYYTSVSILFADIAGFTPLSADMPAIAVVRFLNFVFAEFDRIMLKHGCEKVKTIGDGYMAVCGAPLECADHAERLAAAALEMQQPIVLPDSIREHLPEGTKLGIRIGLHTGSVVGGVIGEQRFVYDIYSDAVNIAARMESHGEENKIHISNDFYRHLQNRFAMTKNTTHGLTFEKRGEMEIKGKGMMRTYFLEKQ